MIDILDERIYNLLTKWKNENKYNYVSVLHHILKEYVFNICLSDSVEEIIFSNDNFCIDDIIFVIEWIKNGKYSYKINSIGSHIILTFNSTTI